MFTFPGVQRDVMLAPFTTYKIGGPADYYIAVTSAKELADAVIAARTQHMPYFILGCGANILVTDKGFRGLVIHNRAEHVTFLDNNRVKAESGAVIAHLIEQTRDHGLSGLEHFVGIPSTVGGAIWQNLHFLAPDRQSTLFIDSVVVEATILDENNVTRTVSKDYFEFGYDDTILHHKPIVVLDVTFQLTPKPKAEIQAQMEANLEWRRTKQPQLEEYPSCGSVFKKIDGVGAGRLIDEAGLKGTVIGGAQISPKHANFLVNLGGAKAADILALIALIREKVYEKTGYSLEPEIGIIGER